MAADKFSPPVEYLHECFTYDPETGDLTWKRRPLEHFKNARYWKIWNTRYSEKVIGCLSRGYLVGNLNSVTFQVHRVVWAMTHGAWPENEIDHRNGTRSDNRICNLRESTHSENGRNRGASKNNTSGFKGVSYDKRRSSYHAKIHNRHIGYYPTPELAHAAYCAEADRLHGEFVNHGITP